MTITGDKAKNIAVAVKRIQEAKQKGCTLAILPECFNGLYEIELFRKNAEVIPSGETSKALSQAAKSNQIYVVGGSIPELCDDKIYNTCTVWNPNGNMIATYRKVYFIRLFS
uniref:omega-amidase n=1 Tax=Sipha flava TaxID=143950 RepID=A0A2S2PUQ6_9HEMI